MARSGKRSALLTLTWARVRTFVREPAAIFWVFGFPIILAVALGIAFRDQPPEPARAGIVEGAPRGDEVAGWLAPSPMVDVVRAPAAEMERRLASGAVDVVVELAPGGEAAPGVTYRFDPTRAEGVSARYVVDAVLQRALGRDDRAAIQEATDVPRGHRYIDFLLPGLIGMNLLGSGLWGVGYNVVQERNKKLLRRFAVTPMRRSDFLLSFILSRLLFLTVELFALIGFGVLVFDVTVQGAIVSLTLVALVGAVSFTGLAILLASRTSSTEVANGLMNVVTLPMWVLSGVFFSYERFPEVLHPAIQALPLTALNDALRAIMNDGASLTSLGPELAVMAAWGLLPFLVAVRIFKWK